MTRIQWDEIGKRFYETGISRVVLYVQEKSGTYGVGVPWSGVVSINEKPSGGDKTSKYADNIKYVSLRAAEDFKATIQAYTYPDEFMSCDGQGSLAKGITIGQQGRKSFGLAYRTEVGNDTEGIDLGYKLHLIYGASAAVSEKNYQTTNESPDAITFSWEIDTIPVAIDGFKPTAVVTVDSRAFTQEKMKKLEDVLYGESENPRLPLPSEVKTLLTQD